MSAAVPLLAASACNILGPVGYLVAGAEKAPALYTLEKTRPTVVFIDGRGSTLPNRAVRQKIAQAAERVILDGGAVEHTHVIGSEALVLVSGGERFSKPLPIADVGKRVGAEVVIYATPDLFTLSPDGQTYSPSATLRVKVVDAKNEARLWPEGQQEWYTLQIDTPVENGKGARNSTELATAQLDLAERTGKALGQLFTKHAAREDNPRIGG